jgi:cytoplasmic iron level regulating protein YaaA (DUF328/UPF0246 family)
MLILLSPSKTINFKPVADWVSSTEPQFLDQSQQLVAAITKLGTNVGTVFGVSEKIAAENRQQFLDWSRTPSNNQATPAAWAYRGETFVGLSAELLDQASVKYAQDHLYVISGLYGLLRPLDRIMPYRLEMITRLKGEWGSSMYDFWGNKLATHVTNQHPNCILACASDAYLKVVSKHLPSTIPIITPKFLHNGKSKMAFAKYSRGLLARWAIENRIGNPKGLKQFNAEGYRYDAAHSNATEPVFIIPSNFTLKGRWTKL